MEKLFRILVIASISLYLVEVILPFVDYLWLTQEELDLMSWTGYGGAIKSSYTLYWVMSGVWVGLFVGLFFFISVARKLFIAYLILILVLTPFFGYSVQAPFAGALNTITNILDGAIIAIAYLTSVDKLFNKEQSKKAIKGSDSLKYKCHGVRSFQITLISTDDKTPTTNKPNDKKI
jgi:hypothetical protein